MKSVFTFWQMPDETKRFVDYLSKTGDVLAIDAVWVASEQEVIPKPIEEVLKDTRIRELEIGLANHFTKARLEVKVLNGKVIKGYDIVDAPLLRYSIGNLVNGTLSQSNVCAYWSATNGSKPQSFVKWGKQVFSWLRKAADSKILFQGFPYRATAAASQAAVAGLLRVSF